MNAACIRPTFILWVESRGYVKGEDSNTRGSRAFENRPPVICYLSSDALHCTRKLRDNARAIPLKVFLPLRQSIRNFSPRQNLMDSLSSSPFAQLESRRSLCVESRNASGDRNIWQLRDKINATNNFVGNFITLSLWQKDRSFFFCRIRKSKIISSNHSVSTFAQLITRLIE